MENSKPKCNGSSKPEMSKTSQDGRVASPIDHPLPSTCYIGKRKAEELTKDKNGKSEEKEKPIELKAIVKLKDQGLQVNKVAKFEQPIPTRPSNPFAKVAANQPNSSLFDSLKKMNKVDNKGKL